jgi:hypothetical protein
MDAALKYSSRLYGEARFDGKWVLVTNTKLPAEQVALKYKELWRVERVFRDVKFQEYLKPSAHFLK